MTSGTHVPSATDILHPPTTTFALAYALGLVGAGLAAVAVLIYGLLSLGRSPDATVWALAGLIAYLAVWGWGLRLASRT